MPSNLISCQMYFVFIEIAENHYLQVELAVVLNCRHQIRKHLVHINFPLLVIIHLTMTSSSVYKKYQCNQLTIIDEMHRLRQIDSNPHRRVLSTPMNIHINMMCTHRRQLHHQQHPIYAHLAADPKKMPSKWNNHN